MFREDFLNRRVFSYQIGDYVKVSTTEGGSEIFYTQTIYGHEHNGSCLGSIV